MKNAVLFSLLFLFGCASTANLMYRPKGSTEAPWQISVVAKQNSFTLEINGEVVIDETVGAFQTEKEFRAKFKGSEVVAYVQAQPGLMSQINFCQVTIDGEVAGRFKL